MQQDQQLLYEFHTLPPDKQVEVIDFIRFLNQRQAISLPHWDQQESTARQVRMQKAVDLLEFWMQQPLDSEEQEVWETLEQEGISPVSFQEPDFSEDS